MRYKGFILDEFQVKAIDSLLNGNSVVVSAATGTGKTLIADYIIDKAIKDKKQIFYTAPIKALSNQKYKDFKTQYGEENVGIMTGDVVINSKAPIVVMTTEIYRNMLIVNDPIVNNVSFIVFDEIHYINDIERGTIWEESIIFSPEHIRFLCLSATIPNAREFSDWIENIKHHKVDTIIYSKRAVPLKHFLFDTSEGIISPLKFKKLSEESPLDFKISKKRRKKLNYEPPTHIELIKSIKGDKLPTIFFVFSRKATELKAKELSSRFDLTTTDEKKRILSVFNNHVKPEIKNLASARKLRKILPKGIAFHHAGLMPNLKVIVEMLFAQGLIKVLYATETFAVGINMPAKSVCFNSLLKYDGINFRYLNSKEYFQMAGRAGRRGIDKEGSVFVLYDRSKDNVDQIIEISSRDKDPIISQFKLSTNTILNLINYYDSEEIELLLKSSFDHFLRKRQNKNVRIMASWNKRVKRLKKLGYISNNDVLTEKGWFARHIYSNEIVVTEVFGTRLYDKLSDEERIITAIAIMYEPRRGNKFYKANLTKKYALSLIRKLSGNPLLHKEFLKRTNQSLSDHTIINLTQIVLSWLYEGDFNYLLTLSNLLEGDIIRLFRQGIDLLRQIKKATQNKDQKEDLNRYISMIDKDVVKVEF